MEEEPNPKRHKISRGDDDYVPGNITKIELCNFMTFDKLTCKPGSRLNLVIGPNGSGKSSLVCAIALGLGGEPQLLGRATSIGAYVKRGEESGYIKISLRGERKEEPITITRKIDTRNKSEWLYNGKAVGKKEINEITKRFNVQVNNLTQFLPQDRVCEFAKLTPIQLLEETEKAVGDPQLPIQHQALVTKSQELKKLERAMESNKGSLDHLKAHNAELEKDVERFRQRDELLAKVESMKKKLPWLKYDMKKTEFLEAMEKEKDARLKVDEAKEKEKELTEPIQKLKGEKAKLEAKGKKIGGLLESNMKKRQQLFERDSQLRAQINAKYDDVKDSRREEESRQQKMSKVKQDLAAAEAELASFPPYEIPKHKMDELRSRISELEGTTKELRYEKKEKERELNNNQLMWKQCDDKLKEMGTVTSKRLQALRNSGSENIDRAYQWIQENRTMFNEDVYGPALLEVNVSDKSHADYLEDHVPNYIWKSFITQDKRDRNLLSFITQDKRDRNLLVNNLKDQKFSFPVVNYAKGDQRPRKPFQITDEMRKLGISSRLDQIFDAPHAVKAIFIDHCAVDNSYIGSRQADANADLVHRLGISDFWTPENHYVWKKSRYGAHESTIVDSVKPSRLLFCSADVNEIEKTRLKQKSVEENMSSIEAYLKTLQTTLIEKEDEAAELRRQREELFNKSQEEKKKLNELKTSVNQKRRLLESLERADDLDTTIANLLNEVKGLKIQRFQQTVDVKTLLVEAVADRRRLAENYMCSFELDAKIKEMDSYVNQQKAVVAQASRDHEHCKKILDNCHQQLALAKRQAESVALLTHELQQEFLEMPCTIEELEAAIQDTKSQADSILCLNPNVLQEYETRRRKIEELMENQEMDKIELDVRTTEINALKESWLPTLRTLVNQINETFSRNFQEMAVAGEVSLDEHGMDFDQYGILIKVKFRQTGQLQVLSAHHQSGGERSVSTILYLVSLQDLTNCPFRVVDEINQGMDPINERKMFQQLVRAASQPNTPQCFLLTPKLLPNLEYSDACSILTVMNGPWIEEPSKVWSGGDSWGSLRIPMEENSS